MKNYEVGEELLTGLGQDQGFDRFCNEWVSRRGGIGYMQTNQQDTDALNEMKEKLREQKNLIRKLIVSNRKRFDAEIASSVNDLELTLMISKYEQNRYPCKAFNSKTNLRINTKNPRDQQILKRINFHIPTCGIINFTFSKNNEKMVRKFFEKVFPKKTERFHLCYSSVNNSNKNATNIGGYLKKLQLASLTLIKVLRLDEFSINQAQFKRIFSLFKGIRTIEFGRCMIDLDTTPDLSLALKKCTLNSLKFNFCYINCHAEIDKKVENCQNLIQALSQSPDLIQSLEKLILIYTGLTKGVVERISKMRQLRYILDNKSLS
ncbi:unnamed protein product [Moneuplotes crassus]|uniref:Uncharacterized protein n=1 Tax=Euplotes crassus TaxID=5936 RepID=A0AAD1XKT0_EUPCR|nr:unnamed protein product [Moneuplotes crassus]